MLQNDQSTHDIKKWGAALAGLVACAAVVLTGLGALADDRPQDPHSQVNDAIEVAERAAATESALRQAEASGASIETSKLERAGRAFETVDLPTLPDDWKEAGLDPSKAELENGKLVQTLSNGLKVTFTIDPEVQAHLENKFNHYTVPHGSVVLVEPETGRVLAMVSHTEDTPKMPALARHASAPSASVFKIVTAAALIESAGLNPNAETCYHGGRSRLTARNIKGDPRRDKKCADLGKALGWSINSVMAKRTFNSLSRDDLDIWARRFGYNTEIPFELPVEVSKANVVKDPLERARMAAGFWHSYLSPLHGALIGAAVANDGIMMQPSLIEKVEGPDGKVLKEFDPTIFRRVMAKKTAEVLQDLLGETTHKGTARRYFAHRGAFPNDVYSAGKTGTLSNKDPYLSFTWFVGFGRHETVNGRQAAVSGLICNKPKWWIKGPYIASEGLRKYFDVAEDKAEVATSD